MSQMLVMLVLVSGRIFGKSRIESDLLAQGFAQQRSSSSDPAPTAGGLHGAKDASSPSRNPPAVSFKVNFNPPSTSIEDSKPTPDGIHGVKIASTLASHLAAVRFTPQRNSSPSPILAVGGIAGVRNASNSTTHLAAASVSTPTFGGNKMQTKTGLKTTTEFLLRLRANAHCQVKDSNLTDLLDTARVSDAKLQDNTTLRSCAQLGGQKMCGEEVTSFTFQMGVDDPALRRYRVANTAVLAVCCKTCQKLFETLTPGHASMYRAPVFLDGASP